MMTWQSTGDRRQAELATKLLALGESLGHRTWLVELLNYKSKYNYNYIKQVTFNTFTAVLALKCFREPNLFSQLELVAGFCAPVQVALQARYRNVGPVVALVVRQSLQRPLLLAKRFAVVYVARVSAVVTFQLGRDQQFNDFIVRNKPARVVNVVGGILLLVSRALFGNECGIKCMNLTILSKKKLVDSRDLSVVRQHFLRIVGAVTLGGFRFGDFSFFWFWEGRF
jgi:hypothetical protein